jgi:Ran GTPase-activating protein (RanGAP) involved in mRNA processing and transport
MPAEPEPEPEPELELTAEHAVEELTKMFQLVGRLHATAIISLAPDTLHPACSKAEAALRHYIARIEGMPPITVDRYASSQKKAAAEAESRLRRSWLNEVQRLLTQVEQVRGGDAGGGGGASQPSAIAASGAGMRVGRSIAGAHPMSHELISEASIRSLLAEPAEGIASLDGKIVFTDPAIVAALGSAIDGNVQTLVTLSLRSCELSDEALDALGPALQEHPTLTSLDLSDNNLSGAGAEALVEHVLAPAEPGKKRRVKSDVGVTQLESGDLVHLSWEVTKQATPTKINHGEIVDGPGLRVLNLSENPLGVNGSRVIGEALGINTSLRSVAMRSVGLGPRGASNLSRFGIERNCGNLATLDLRRNNIGNAGAAALAAGLKANPGAITSLDLTSNGIGQVGAASLAEVLAVVESRLQVLHLGGNPITCTGVSILAEEAGRAVASGQRLPNGLCELFLPNCELAPPPPIMPAVPVSGAGTDATQVELELDRRHLLGQWVEKEKDSSKVMGPGAADALQQDSEAIAKEEEEEGTKTAGVYWARFINARSLLGRSMKSLELKNNALDDSMVSALASAWRFHMRSVRDKGGDLLRIVRLDLSGNPAIGDAGVAVLSQSIGAGAAPALEWLSLACLGFGTEGARAIAAALCSSGGTGGGDAGAGVDDDSGVESEAAESSRGTALPSTAGVALSPSAGGCPLTTLVLSGNSIGVPGKAAVAKALEHPNCRSLTDLQMSRMQWDDDGAALLAEALKCNSTLLSLDLGGNALGLQGICTLGWALSEKNQTLTSLRLWNNSGARPVV